MRSPARAFMLLFAILFPVVLFCGVVDAGMYDDFTGSDIDPNKWTITGNGFTQPGDGYLYYSGTTAENSMLTSTKGFPSGIFTMPFSDYSSDNSAPAGEGLGSVVAIGLGCRNSGAWVRIERGQVLGTSEGQYIEVNWAMSDNPNEIFVNYVQSDIKSGFLQLRHDGTCVTFYYRTLETDPWTQMVITGHGGRPVLDANGQTQPLVITPGWTTTVPLFIQAIPGGDSSTPSFTLSFKVDYVRTNGVPYIIHNLRHLLREINNLDTACFKKANQKRTFTNKLHAVVRKVREGSYADALDKLQNDILPKTDGCALEGMPEKNDWITDCNAQSIAYPIILDVISELQELIHTSLD